MPLGFQVQLNDEAPIRAGGDAMSVLTQMERKYYEQLKARFEPGR